MFKGSIVAIITPFKDGKIDEETYRELIEFQIEKGVHGHSCCDIMSDLANPVIDWCDTRFVSIIATLTAKQNAVRS